MSDNTNKPLTDAEVKARQLETQSRLRAIILNAGAQEVNLPPQFTAAQLSELRRVVLELLDDGRPLELGGANPWAFYPHNGTWRDPGERNIAHRMDFCDAIARKLEGSKS